MSLHLEAIGTAVPRHFIEQTDAVEVARDFCASSCVQPRVLARLYARSGVRTRHSVVLRESTNGAPANQSFYLPASGVDDLGPTTAERMRVYEEAASQLGVRAGADALAIAETAPREVTHLITVSCTGFHSPGVDVALVRELGLDAGVARTHVGFMGCHAALNALRVAKAFTDSRPEACVLVCAVELCSLHYQYGWDPDRLVSNALFADGAAAVVARSSLGSKGGQPGGWQLISSASAIVPETEDAMRWHIRDHGFEMGLSARVPDLIRERLRPWLASWLADADLSIEEVGSWAIHPGGPRILTACGLACDLSEPELRASADVLAEYGNMSSPTILFILERLRRQSAAGPCVALAFGPGLTIEAALFH
ncbi:MAG TPA: type III polyketide synthase [Pirellulales bacterium]|nr:type III polyketide synthase [Pirellulales bacterium]